jgi:hypothetical protein
MRRKPKTIQRVGFSVFLGGILSLWATPVSLQAQASQEKTEVKESVPKPPENDFVVQVYKALDAKKTDRLTFKEKYKVDKTDTDIEVVLSYYNWSINDEDFWNRQLSIEFKTMDGFIVEKIVKSGFGELGYVKKGDDKTQDVYKKEKIITSGGTARAVMNDLQIGDAERQRFHSLLEKYVVKK